MDCIVKALDTSGAFRFSLVQAKETVETLRTLHNASPTATAAMGRLAMITAILRSDYKNKESVTVIFRGDGPGGTLVAVSDTAGSVRCSAICPQADLPNRPDGHLDVGSWVGQGTLSVIRALPGKEPFSGTVPITTGEIAEDMASYFYYSEQTPSVVSLGVLIDTDYSCLEAGGLFIQALPGAKEESLIQMEEAVAKLPSMTALLQEGLPLEKILEKYFSAFSIETLQRLPLTYECPCSREGVKKAILSLPKEDLLEMAEKDGGAEVVCEFCNTKYQFSAEELKEGTHS